MNQKFLTTLSLLILLLPFHIQSGRSKKSRETRNFIKTTADIATQT